MVRSLSLIVILVVVGGLWWLNQTPPTEPTTPKPPTLAEATSGSDFAYPIAEFEKRITKKPFGFYNTPENSPVPNDRFSGWHTGPDVEYEDVAGDVPVFAVADGTVVQARRASGYGGVVVIRHRINDENVLGVYGHVDPNSLPRVGAQITKGEQIAILGEGYSTETDGERKHLHFGLVREGAVGNPLLGYVATEAQLAPWLDPMSLYR